MTTTTHGGDCCGVIHLHNFDDFDDNGHYAPNHTDGFQGRLAWVVDQIANGLDRWYNIGNSRLKNITRPGMNCWQTLVEVVLAPCQIRDWTELLTHIGFKEVNQFINSNSGNTLRVYHFVTNYKGLDRKKGVLPDIGQPQPVPTASTKADVEGDTAPPLKPLADAVRASEG